MVPVLDNSLRLVRIRPMQKLTPLILIASALAVFADAPASPPLVKILPAAPAEVTPAAMADLELGVSRQIWVALKATEIGVFPA